MHLEDYIDQPTGCVLIHTLSRADGMIQEGIWENSDCIHQLILQSCLKVACVILRSSLWLVPINACHVTNMLIELSKGWSLPYAQYWVTGDQQF